MATPLPPETVRPRTFTDARGRTIEAFVSIETAIRLQDELGIDIDQMATGETMQGVFKDKRTLVAVLWLLCEASASAQEITPEDFARSIGGDSFEDALAAMEEALISFFQRSQRTVLRAIQKKSNEIFDLATTKVMKAVEAVNPEAALASLNIVTNNVPSPDSPPAT